MPLFSADSKTFKKNFFCPLKVEKQPSKVAQKYSNFLAAKMAQTEEFLFQNVAYRLYIKLGSVTIDKLEFIMYRIKKDNRLSHHPEVKNLF